MSETNARVGVTIGTKAETAPVDRYTASVRSMNAAIKDFFASKSVATAGVAFGGSFAAAGLTVEKMVSRITEAISGSSELASEMSHVERRVGLAGEAFQVLSRVGKASSEELIASLGIYRRKLGEALEGDLNARKMFGAQGLSPEALTRLPMVRQLEIVGEAIGRLGDKHREAAVSAEFFGRGYAAMLPVLDKLRVEGYDKLRASVGQTAGVLDKELAAALGKAKKSASEASAQLSTSLAQANLRLLEIKASVTRMLADNAGTIQSVGSGLATGFLTASVLTTLASRLGPQLTVIGSQGAAAFSKGFGVGAALLPGIIAERMAVTGATSFAALGKALATPFGAALAVAVGAILIHELERVAMEEIARRDSTSRAAADRFRALQERIKGAASSDEATAAQIDAAQNLSARKKELDDLDAREANARRAIAEMKLAPGQTRPEFRTSDEDKKARENLETQVRLAERLVVFANARGQAIATANKAQREATDLAFAESAELEKTRGQREGLLEREKQNRFNALTDDAARLEFLQAWRREEEEAFNKKIAETRNAELASDRELEKRVRLADIDAKIAQARAHAADEAERAADEAAREVDRMLERLDRERRHEIVRGLDSELGALAIERAKTEGDFTKTNSERWRARLAEIEARVAAVNSAMQDLEARKAVAAGMGMSTDAHEGEIQRMRNELAQLQIDRLNMGPDPTSWVEQTAAALAQLRDSWGTTAQQIGATISGTIGGAVDTIADNITRALLVTGDWGLALQEIGMTIGTEIIRSIIAMGARWVATHIMMAIAGKALAAASLAASTPIAMAQSAIWAAPATLATIASFGGAAEAAPLEIAGAIGATAALGVAGFEEGGFTGGAEGELAGVVHGREFVFSAPAVRNLGADNLAALHREALNPSAPSPAGGGAATGPKNGPRVRIAFVMDKDQNEMERLQRDPHYRTQFVKFMRSMRGEMGIDF